MSAAKKIVKIEDSARYLSPKVRRVQTRSPRAKITPFAHVTIEMQFGKEWIPVKLLNISTSGVGFAPTKKTADFFEAGELFKARLKVKGKDKEIKTKILIQQVDKDYIGSAFIDYEPLLPVTIAHYFDVELSALEVIKIKASQLDHPKSGKNFAFRGKDQCSLDYQALDNGKVTQFKIGIFGNVIEWHQGAKSAIILTEGSPDEHLKRLFMKFILNIQNLDDQHASQMTELVQTARV
ncbi:MAG: hypothetical protein KA715_13395 [Xanthomonadaceae bacterium]|nr:hypothetical protein [Xanthomonadaceae bacterium]